MRNKLFQKTTLFSLVKITIISVVIIVVFLFIFRTNSTIKTEVLEVKSVASVIQADGVVASQNRAALHFQTGGKLIYLPFKEGDKIYQGQIVAQLDTAKLAANLRQAEQDFIAAKAQSERLYDKQGNKTDESFDEKVARTAIDAAQNKAYDNVVKARQDLADAVLTSPINGVITQEDVTVTGINVTPSTSFTVADPSTLIFQANVLENDVDFLSIGNVATISFGDESGKSITGIVSKIYPDKITLSTGQKAYLVDIESAKADQLSTMGKSGTVLIQSNSQNNVKLVPTWAVLNHSSIWVLANNKPVLRDVKAGKTHGNLTEIIDGLAAGDKVIINPESIAAEKYTIL
jgi:RND family efflux transporter MFP subunit